MKKGVILVFIVALCVISCKKNTTIIFQDDFEKYPQENIILEPWEMSGKVNIDTTKAFSGKKSIQFISGEGYKQRAFITLKNRVPKEMKSYYGSLKMYVEEASPDGIHWTMIQASGKTPKGFLAEVRYGGQHNKRIMANYDTQIIKTDCWHHTQFKIPEKRWFSIQWYMNRETNNMKLWIDDELIHELNANTIDKGCLNNENNSEWTFPLFENITLGWVDYQLGGGQREVWIDDVILSTTYIDSTTITP
ncbi:hypothetical protein [Tenacibaculum agarivorans]|uniref:hypothetical protein n=1 Tax=Tenacibaculum agarivorans TaxID=1908389 RepID=UPI00094BA0AC|nr:hypothetical protein [Tenacibaculum agarivorans]